MPPPVEQQANVPAPKRVTISSEFGVTNLNVLEGHPISQHHPPPPVGGDQYGCLPFGPAAAAVAAAGSPTGDMQAQSSQVNVDVGHHVHVSVCACQRHSRTITIPPATASDQIGLIGGSLTKHFVSFRFH